MDIDEEKTNPMAPLPAPVNDTSSLSIIEPTNTDSTTIPILQEHKPEEVSDTAVKRSHDPTDTSINMKKPRSETQVIRRTAKKEWKSKIRALEAGEGTKADYKSVFGEDCVCSIELIHDEKLQLPKDRLKVRDLHMLLLWVVAKAVNQRWVFVKHGPVLERIVVVVVDGLSERLYRAHRHLLPALEKIHFTNAPTPYPLHVPCSIFTPAIALQHFLNCMVDKITGIERPKKQKEEPVGDTSKVDTYSEELFVASADALREHGFPLEHVGKCEFFKETFSHDVTDIPSSIVEYLQNKENVMPTANSIPALDPSKESTPSPNAQQVDEVTEKEETTVTIVTTENVSTVSDDAIPAPSSPAAPAPAPTSGLVNLDKWRAVDCEFVEGEKGKMLARMTILNGHGDVLVDELVKPDTPVIDYLTRYSGITAELLKTATLTFEQAQALFLHLVRKEHILVGHSLENDLRVMNIIHRRVIDTTILYPHPRGSFQRSSLKYLAQVHLGKVIQNDECGHNSEEDASIALQLARSKVSMGPSYGQPNTHVESFLSILGKLNQRVRFFCQAHILRKFNSPYTDFIVSSSDADSVARAAKVLRPKPASTAMSSNSNPKKEMIDDDSSDSNNSDSESDAENEPTPKEKEKAEMILLYLNEANRWFDFEKLAERPEEGSADSQQEAPLPLLSSESEHTNEDNDWLPADLPQYVNFNTMKATLPPLKSASEITPPKPERDPTKILTSLNSMFETLIDAAPKNTMFVVMSGQASIRTARHHSLNIQRLKTLNEYYPTDETRAVLAQEEAAFQKEMQENQNGVVFLGVKP